MVNIHRNDLMIHYDFEIESTISIIRWSFLINRSNFKSEGLISMDGSVEHDYLEIALPAQEHLDLLPAQEQIELGFILISCKI